MFGSALGPTRAQNATMLGSALGPTRAQNAQTLGFALALTRAQEATMLGSALAGSLSRRSRQAHSMNLRKLELGPFSSPDDHSTSAQDAPALA